MPKGYLLSAHRSPADPIKREAYLKLAGPAIIKAGGKILASTSNVKAYENGKFSRECERGVERRLL